MAAYKRNTKLAYVYVTFIGMNSIPDIIRLCNLSSFPFTVPVMIDLLFMYVIISFIIDLKKLKVQNDRNLYPSLEWNVTSM